MKNRFELILGTAFWGWKIEKALAFQLLERMYASGNRLVDAATNYPMNAIPNDFRLGEQIIQEFTQAHGINDLKILMKVGSQTNARSAECNLSKSFILMMAEEYKRMYDTNLYSIMVHWDNRESAEDIQETLEALEKLYKEYKLRPGLSGIRFPDTYASLSADKDLPYIFEGKHNPFYSDVARYAIQPKNDFFVYGINAGGVKLDGNYTEDSTLLKRGADPKTFAKKLTKIQEKLPTWNTNFVRRPIKSMNQLGLIHAYNHPQVTGAIIGPSDLNQLNRSLDFVRDLELFDYTDVSDYITSKVQ